VSRNHISQTRPHTTSAQKITRLHTSIASKFLKYLPDEVIIGTDRNNYDNWKRAAPTDEPIRFWMWDKQSDIGQTIAPRKGERLPCPVVRLENIILGEVPWVGWYEEWLPSTYNRGEFEFKTASLTFFWGRVAQSIDQIFRAEWVEPSHGSNNAATPHWHIDWELAELGKSMSGIHLGMAGWEFTGDGIKCWQKGVYGDWNSISTWAEQTLFYAQNQLKNFPLV